MPVPLALSIPAAAAGLAYLDAKTGFSYDKRLGKGVFAAAFRTKSREWRDRYNFFYRLEEVATSKSAANRTFILFEDRSWTYAEAYEAALKYGNYLKTRYDVKPKDIVALNFPNSDHYVLLWFGLWSIGARPAFINYNLTGDALCHCVNMANTKLMLVDPELADHISDDVRSKIGGLTVEFLTDGLIGEILRTDPTRPPDSLRTGEQGRDLAILIFTSGTTGLPKAAIVSWKKLVIGGSFAGGWMGTKTSDIFYTPMPLYHGSAAVIGLAQCLESECTIAIGRKFSTKTFWKEVRQHNATIIQYVGETCRYLLAAPPEIELSTGENLDRKHSVRLACGNGLRPDVWESFRDRFDIPYIAELYAATEGFSGTFNFSSNDFSSGAVGRHGLISGALITRRTVIVERDAETDMPYRDPKTGLSRKVRSGEPGELLYQLSEDWQEDFQGYYNNSQATDSKILRDVLKKGDAYFRTGDLISRDSEGRVFFHDRVGDTFRWKSENVATTEVSETMGRHGQVHEANVYGVQLPNHDGRAGCAAITLGQDPGDALLRSLAEHAQKQLPKYAVPLFLRIGKGVAAAVTGTNKQQKHELRVQGVDPTKVGEDEIYWLKGGTYVKFRERDWDGINAGQVKL